MVATTAIAFEVSKYALTRAARKEIGERQAWTCQGVDGEPCIHESLSGDPARFSEGFMVTAAHYKETHHLSGKGYHDPNPDNTRILCQADHACEHIDMGNNWGAQKLLDMGTYHVKHIKETDTEQEYLTLDEALELRERARELSQERKEDIQAQEDKEALKHVRGALKSIRGTRL